MSDITTQLFSGSLRLTTTQVNRSFWRLAIGIPVQSPAPDASEYVEETMTVSPPHNGVYLPDDDVEAAKAVAQQGLQYFLTSRKSDPADKFARVVDSLWVEDAEKDGYALLALRSF